MADAKKYYSDIVTGFEFAPSVFQIDAETVSKYLRATEDDNPIHSLKIVPPMAVAAFAIREMANRFVLPEGTVHVSQQLEFIKAAAIGETLTSLAKVTRKVQRGKFNMLNISFNVVNHRKEPVLTGEAGFILHPRFAEQ